MTFVDELMSGDGDYRVSRDIGGAIFSATSDSEDALGKFQPVAQRIIANNGLGYHVKLTHRSSDHAANYIDRIVIDF